MVDLKHDIQKGFVQVQEGMQQEQADTVMKAKETLKLKKPQRLVKKKLKLKRADARADVVTESEGFQLQLSSRNVTGYRGVARNQGKFQARICKGSDGKYKHIGSFDTAVEAAVAQARARASDHSSVPSSANVGDTAPRTREAKCQPDRQSQQG